jgi:hypothetical protein
MKRKRDSEGEEETNKYSIIMRNNEGRNIECWCLFVSKKRNERKEAREGKRHTRTRKGVSSEIFLK